MVRGGRHSPVFYMIGGVGLYDLNDVSLDNLKMVRGEILPFVYIDV